MTMTYSLMQDALQQIRSNSPKRREIFDALLNNKTQQSTLMLLDLLEDLRVPPLYTELLHELGCRKVIDPVVYFEDLIYSTQGPPNLESHQLAVLFLLPEYRHHALTISMITHILESSQNLLIQKAAVYTLACLNSDEAVYILSRLLYAHPNPRIRHHVLSCLGSCQNPHSVITLLAFLEHNHALTDEGTIPNACVNAMHGLGRLWKSAVQPFDTERWLKALTFWLYRDQSSNPPALYHLNHTGIPESHVIIEGWHRWRHEQNHDTEDIPVFC